MKSSLNETIKAFQKAIHDGIAEIAADKGVKNIEGWMETLEKADFRGAKTIHDNLGKLKTHLESEKLDGKAIGELLNTLGEETKRAASHAKGEEAEKITELGELLSKASHLKK